MFGSPTWEWGVGWKGERHMKTSEVGNTGATHSLCGMCHSRGLSEGGGFGRWSKRPAGWTSQGWLTPRRPLSRGGIQGWGKAAGSQPPGGLDPPPCGLGALRHSKGSGHQAPPWGCQSRVLASRGCLRNVCRGGGVAEVRPPGREAVGVADGEPGDVPQLGTHRGRGGGGHTGNGGVREG